MAEGGAVVGNQAGGELGWVVGDGEEASVGVESSAWSRPEVRLWSKVERLSKVESDSVGGVDAGAGDRRRDWPVRSGAGVGGVGSHAGRL
ncbi:hypothetical protein M5K25_003950 [Dendrobium thyrsiflorum]|uniref:Uncharacterized protein n=1 Tax=Dendrobium thyrsiflorum TaxID=117978 RepID=A0ABD0VKJ2_DENTH